MKNYKPSVRRPRFDFSRVNTHYLASNAVATHFMNAMQVIVPIGEDFFIRSVRPFVNSLSDPEQVKRVKAFIAQEKIHENAHLKFWQVLEEQGFKLSLFGTFYESTAFGFIEPFFRRLLGRKFSLSVTVALEHYTAVMAAFLMQDDHPFLRDMDDGVRELILWHFAEEIEHKSVAFDVLQKVDPSYLLRAGGMVFASSFLFFYIFSGQLSFIWQDKKATPAKLLADLKEGGLDFARLFAYTAGQVADYFRPDFHPDDLDNYHLIEQYMPADLKLA